MVRTAGENTAKYQSNKRISHAVALAKFGVEETVH